jgi:hypothetical protein
MARGTPANLSLGPGTLYINNLNGTEPTDLVTAWTSLSPNPWTALGYTDQGSTFKYTIATGNVTVAEELDNVSIQTTGRSSDLTFALAEITATNLMRAMNAPNGAVVTAGGVATIEPPDLGTETRRMLGWQAEDASERWIFRQCFQSGDMTIQRQKGANNATLALDFSLEKPFTGLKLFKVIMSTSNPNRS